jgi:uncharacterized protein with HEPN domain
MNQDAKAKVFLGHILESIQLVDEYVRTLTKDEFIGSKEKQDAIIRRVEIIGEAVKNLPRVLRRQHPEIPWDEIAGTRDFLVHHYFGVDLDTTWKITQNDLPKLKVQIQAIVDQLP